ncbi:MAG: ATP-binding protein [Desulfopila sp.]
MKIAEFIRNNLETILQEWEQFTHSIQPKSGDLDKKALRDHTEYLLSDIVEDLDSPQSKYEQREKSIGQDPKSINISFAEKHGLDRFYTDFLLIDIIAEYRFLRATVLRLWNEHNPSTSVNTYDLIRFNEALDQQIFEAAGRFHIEREQAKEALSESERRFRTLIMASNEVIYQMNPDWSEMRRLSGGSFLTDTIKPNSNWLQEYIHPEDQSQVIEMINKAVMTKSIFEFEHRVFSVDGTLGWVSSRAVPLLDSDGQITEWFGVASDITVRKRAEKALQALNDELENRVEQGILELQETHRQYLHAEKLSAIGQLSSSIAHELMNPLQGIKTVLKGVKRRAVVEEEDKELLDLAIAENERMANLIKSLREFHQPSTGKRTLMDLHDSLHSLLLLYKSNFKRNRISTVLNCAEGLPQIEVVSDQIKQVFLNLLNNAQDACSEKGGGVITISTCYEDQRIAITIQDTGVGFAPDIKDQIFAPFFSTKPREKGTGLGLSVCKKIIEQHHQGEIQVESEPGKGSTFTVLLPAV